MSLTNLLSKQTKKFNLGSAATRQSPELKKKTEFQVCSQRTRQQGEQVWKLLKNMLARHREQDRARKASMSLQIHL